MNITNDNFIAEVLDSDKTVLLDFYADWCGPCQMLAPILAEIESERDDVKICKVNVDEEPALATNFGINSIPALFVVKNSEVTAQSLGLRSKEEILKML